MEWFAMSSKFYIDLDDAGVSEGAQMLLARALGYVADNEQSGFLPASAVKKLGLARVPGRVEQLEAEGIMVRVCAVSGDHPCAISDLSLRYTQLIRASSAHHPCSIRGWNFPAWFKWNGPLERLVKKRKADRERIAEKRAGVENVARHPSDKNAMSHNHIDSNKNKEPTYVGSSPPVSNAPVPAKRSRGMRTVDAINETARPLEVYRFMDDYAKTSSSPIDQKTLSQIETAVTPLIAQGIPPEQVAAGIRAWEGSDSFSPTQIAAFVHKAGAKAAAASPASTADERVAQAQSLKAASGNPWPTTRLELS